MTLQLNDNGTPRNLTSGELRDVAAGLGLERGWSNNHGFYNQLDSGVDYVVWPGFATPSPGSGIGAASLGAGTAYIGGARVHYAGGDFAAQPTKDHYLDLDVDGVLTVGIVGVGVAPPAKPPNSLRIARYTTNTTQIATVATGFRDLAGNWVGNYIGKPYARSVRSVAVVLASGTAGMTFTAGSTQYDNAAIHDETSLTERFFAVRPGLYSVSAGVRFGTGQASQAVSIGIRRDGIDPLLGDSFGDPSVDKGLSVSGVIEMNALSYLTLSVTNPASLNVSQAYFQIAKVD